MRKYFKDNHYRTIVDLEDTPIKIAIFHFNNQYVEIDANQKEKFKKRNYFNAVQEEELLHIVNYYERVVEINEENEISVSYTLGNRRKVVTVFKE